MLARKRLFWLASVISLLVLLLTPQVAWLQEKTNLVIDAVDSSGFPTIQTGVTVTDANGIPIPNLDASHFEVFEDEGPVTLSGVTPFVDPGVQVAVALVIDVSGSMAGQPLEDAKVAANAFLDRLSDMDQAAVIAFGDQVNLGEPFPVIDPAKEHDFTADKGALRNVINQLTTQAGVVKTPLYDAAFKAVKMAARQPVGTRAVILFTDGKEEPPVSIMKSDDPINEAQKDGIPVFTIGLGEGIDRAYLQRMALLTGGRYQETPDSGQLAELFQGVADQLKLRYTISYTSKTIADGLEHTLRLKVSPPGVESAEASKIFVPPPPLLPFVRLFYREGEDKILLKDGQRIKSTSPLVPQISAAGVIVRVEYYLDDEEEPVATLTEAPYEWKFGWGKSGLHKVTVKAYDDAEPPNVGQAIAGLDVLPFIRVGETEVTLPKWVPYAVIGAVAVLAFLILALVLARRQPKNICPNCGRVMDPDWVECLFCAGERPPTEARVISMGPTIPEQPFAPPPTVPMGERAPGRVPPIAPTEVLGQEPPPTAWLVVEKGERQGKQFPLRAGDMTIGREGTNDIVLDDSAVSRQHAKVRLEGQDFYIYDLAATNPIRVNGQETPRARLLDDDRIEIGHTVLVFKRV